MADAENTDLGSTLKDMATQLATLTNTIKNLEDAPSPKASGLADENLTL